MGERIIPTAEGDVKATDYRVTLTEVELKQLAGESLNVVLHDQETREWIMENWLRYSKGDLTAEELENKNDFLNLILDRL